MSELITQTARLIPYLRRPKQVPSYVTVYTYEPMADEPGAVFGNMYVVMEVLVAGRASVEVADTIIEALGEAYYNQPNTQSSPLQRFEVAIKAVNNALGELVNRGNASWIGKLSAVMAVQLDAEIHVAQTGSAEAYLYRAKAGARINAGSSHRPTTPSKTFVALATGELEPGDKFLLATPALVHQLQLDRLQSIISQSSPNTAIGEITELLKGVSVERIGALVVEVTTPELAALKLRSEAPSEIQLGSPENAFEAAKLAATPIATTTIKSTKTAARTAHAKIKDLKPLARSIKHNASPKLTSYARAMTKPKVLISLAAVIVVTLIAMTAVAAESGGRRKLVTKFDASYTWYKAAVSAYASGSTTNAKSDLAQASSQLLSLASSQHELNQALETTSLPAAQPRTYANMMQAINAERDTVNGIKSASTFGVAKLTDITKEQSASMEITAGKAYVFTGGSKPQLDIVDLSSGATTKSQASFAVVGQITSTSLSYDHTQIFLTSSSGVWSYSIAQDEVEPLTNTNTNWPTSVAIGSYETNLYLLTDDAALKYEESAGEYGKAITYIPLSTAATSLTVDGQIYIASSGQVGLYQSGIKVFTTPSTSAIADITHLRSSNKQAILLAIDSQNNHVLEWTESPHSLTLKQIIDVGSPTITDAGYDATTNAIYEIQGDQLDRIDVQP